MRSSNSSSPRSNTAPQTSISATIPIYPPRTSRQPRPPIIWFSFPGGQHDGGGSCCQPGAAAGSARDLATTGFDVKSVPIIERVVWERPLCKLLHFEKQFDPGPPEPRQRLLIVAPMSGHHATLLRGTVEAFLPFYDVYITDWVDARTIPLVSGRFDLDDYIDYVIAICETLSKEHEGATVHTLGVCQPAVPLSAAVALMEAQESPQLAASMTLMGGA